MEILKYTNLFLVIIVIAWMVIHLRMRGTVDLGKPIELTIRMPVVKGIIYRLLCSLFRSASLFWNPKYGDVVVILDEEDRKEKFPSILKTLDSPFNFRFAYEELPKDLERFAKLRCRYGHTFGYHRMLYSSFFFDKYTSTSSIIAWIDTDVIFTMPVIDHSIIRNGKLVVKGINTFWMEWVQDWNYTTFRAIGLPMISDFMSYYPVYIYPSTIRNCREFIMKRFDVTEFEEAFEKFSVAMVSPVCIILSYAYYFERERYDWHIDIGSLSLEEYNRKQLPYHPLTKDDISPELHVSVHERYYKSTIQPLQQAICYTQIYLGMTITPHCKQFISKPNLQLFEFQTQQTHLTSWCGGERSRYCADLIKQRYSMFADAYRKKENIIDTRNIKVIEEFADANYQFKCSNITYVPFT